MKEWIEEMNLNAWPALQTVLYDGWVLRFAEGYSKRSNSVTPLYPSRKEDIAAKIDECESMYQRNNLPPVFKITPFETSELDLALHKRGYQSVDITLVLICDLTENTIRDRWLGETLRKHVTIESRVSHSWLQQLCQFNSLKREYMDTAYRMLTASPLQQGFFTLYDGEEPAACGFCVVQAGHAGIYDIVTDPRRRRRGYAQELIQRMLVWAQANGAAHAYLLVVEDNLAARKLYEKLDFSELYKYGYRVKSSI
ncbi:GNAT family N-acetyltransferase [Paenibacillus sp. J22TS3]|uniref:GNAT family N-acetyltransferase n=1 Tax=Paenibacillus sp. J22TS3 TaxID=2807192 RepID=UPI001B03E91F|nr:GNAT family N-acetyltransferase [Paenibacillus sp. J22TS3]GIP21539.1 N-acetyltransferase GCN5 [Paenibacillus sp. J22TS3]